MKSREQLQKDLENEIVLLTFTKVNGDTRSIFATMNKEYLPAPKEPTNPNMSRPVPEGNVLFWDLDDLRFKSCKWDNVTEWQITVQ